MTKGFGIDRRFFFAVAGVCFFGSVFSVMAGNEKMVEDAVQELDKLNKQAVNQLPEHPKDGKIDLKAGVTYQDGSPIFDIFEQHTISENSSEKSESIHLDQGYSLPSAPQKRTQP